MKRDCDVQIFHVHSKTGRQPHGMQNNFYSEIVISLIRIISIFEKKPCHISSRLSTAQCVSLQSKLCVNHSGRSLLGLCKLGEKTNALQACKVDGNVFAMSEVTARETELASLHCAWTRAKDAVRLSQASMDGRDGNGRRGVVLNEVKRCWKPGFVCPITAGGRISNPHAPDRLLMQLQVVKNSANRASG